MSGHTGSVGLLIIGGGPAGLAAAVSAREAGVKDLLVLERESALGGILNQCIHNGFGLHTFGEELTGPEYAARYIQRVRELEIPVMTGAMVLDITTDKRVTVVSGEGLLEIKANAVILAMGCRERSRGALNIPGARPVGVYSAGTAQKFVNIDGYLPGREVVVLGSGDIGLIMARRMTLEGARVRAVVEQMPYSGGLKRNIVQCLDDFGIPLLLSHTVTAVAGRRRVEGVTISRVDQCRAPIPGTEETIPCDTLLLSVGLLPENELSQLAGVELSPLTGGAVVGESLQTNVEGIFACGNVLHVHDLVDFVSEESAQAGKAAAAYLGGKTIRRVGIPIRAGEGVRYTVPSMVCPDNLEKGLSIRFRVRDVYRDCRLTVSAGDTQVMSRSCRIMTPGEMETVTLSAQALQAYPKPGAITISVEV